jgi:hypothetical protein
MPRTGAGPMISRVRWSSASWLALGAAAALAGGCASTATSTGDNATEQVAVRSFAKTINLDASDVPSFQALPLTQGESEASPGPLPQSVEQCDGVPLMSGRSHGIVSPVLQKQSVPVQTVLSGVYPMRHPATASEYLAAADSQHGMRCMQREELRKRAGLAGLVRGRSEVVALRPALRGARVSGLRVWKCLAGSQPCKSRSVRSFTDRLWFATGAYVVMLAYIAGPRNEAKTPVAEALPVERRLIALIYQRAQAHKP